jgi:hypothetical protein
MTLSVTESRRHQIFPVLDTAQIEIVKRFADTPPRAFAPGETIFKVSRSRAVTVSTATRRSRASAPASSRAR